jgi:hypothetical protein
LDHYKGGDPESRSSKLATRSWHKDIYNEFVVKLAKKAKLGSGIIREGRTKSNGVPRTKQAAFRLWRRSAPQGAAPEAKADG